MTELDSAAMEDEFGVVARWTGEAARTLGPGHAVPAGCRGSGSTGALRWLADRLHLTSGSLLVDSGAGVGGPAAWAAGDLQARPVCIEPMPDAVRAAQGLFGLPAVVGTAQALPLADDVTAAAWCLGVLCTTQDKAGVLGELHRVLVPGGRLGLLVFQLAGRAPSGPAPDGNSFPTVDELDRLLDEAGFSVVDTTVADLHDNPPGWDDAVDAVDAEIARRHGADPRWIRSHEQSARMQALIESGSVVPRLLVAQSGR
ncbi:MAG: Methyltransferase type 11, S-adenosyl-L-methionine-dependent [Klenkia sp.]|nr:Methyltransferase type 11, S-adenosyl-L-methionine-dependent [Klenkia sp.]